MIRTVCSIAICLVILVVCEARAQSDDFDIRNVTTQDGLTNSFIFEFLQDRHGFIWIAGADGVERFDGYTSRSFSNNPTDVNSLPANYTRHILEHKDRIWVSTVNGLGVIDARTGSMTRPEVPDELGGFGTNHALVEDDTYIWALYNNGIVRFKESETESGTFDFDYFRPDSTLQVRTSMLKMALVADSTIWISSANRFLQFNTKTHEFRDLTFDTPGLLQATSSNQWYFRKEPSGHIILTTSSSIIVWDDASSQPRFATRLDNGNINLIEMTPQGVLLMGDRLWLATSYGGIFILDVNTLEIMKRYRGGDGLRGLQEDDVHALFRDQSGNIWVGYHDFGVSVLRQKSWKYDFFVPISEAIPGSPENMVTKVIEESPTQMWVASQNGLHLHDITNQRVQTFYPDPTVATTPSAVNNIVSLFRYGADLYVVNNRNQMFRFNTNERTFSLIPSLSGGFLFIEPVIVNSRLYLGSYANTISDTLTYGWFEFDTGAYKEFDFLENQGALGNGKAILPMMDGHGNIYYTQAVFSENTEYHFFSLDQNTNELTQIDYRYEYTGTWAPIPVMVGKESGKAMIMSNAGVHVIEFDNVTGYDWMAEYNFMLGDVNPQAYVDSKGIVWYGTRLGIARIDIENRSIQTLHTDANRRLITYIPSTELSTGEIVFHGNGGYITLDPDEIRVDSLVIRLLILELRSGEQIVNTLIQGTEPTFGHLNNNISFSFVGLNYSNPQQLVYRYRLLGQSDEWINLGTQRQVYLANLSPGSYTFEVTTTSRSGTIESETASFSFTISPPWWRTLPAYLLFSILVVGGIVVVDRFMRKRVIYKERERSRDKELQQAREIQKAYDDLQKAREKERMQANEIAQAYENLKSAQEQLVQQEKLASLGQLTAGIAHEIKNPLNFVNNFSSVSIELLDEAIDELNNPSDKAHSLANAGLKEILEDVKINLGKIHEHGSRADSIVKSMLLHSRGGSGNMEPTHLNSMVREYANLSYHGMRASRNSIDADVELDLDERITNVSLISEDFSRVILNICNNAFDAMRERLNQLKNIDKSTGYRPKLKAVTTLENGQIYIRISDNGPGIQPEIREKILQPFFTTKKGTQGTGLGLSITHDIIKAHGGELTIESEVGSGSTFVIKLMNR